MNCDHMSESQASTTTKAKCTINPQRRRSVTFSGSTNIPKSSNGFLADLDSISESKAKNGVTPMEDEETNSKISDKIPHVTIIQESDYAEMNWTDPKKL